MGEQSWELVYHENILMCLDGSSYSEAAFTQAVSLAKACGSKLFLITVVDIKQEYVAYVPQLEDELERSAAENLEKAKKRAAEQGIDATVILSKEQKPYKAIVDAAKKHDVSLIVMGTHGRTGLTRLVMGSVAQGVVARAPCAVLVVPA